jgi:hypothetical protein
MHTWIMHACLTIHIVRVCVCVCVCTHVRIVCWVCRYSKLLCLNMARCVSMYLTMTRCKHVFDLVACDTQELRPTVDELIKLVESVEATFRPPEAPVSNTPHDAHQLQQTPQQPRSYNSVNSPRTAPPSKPMQPPHTPQTPSGRCCLSVYVCLCDCLHSCVQSYSMNSARKRASFLACAASSYSPNPSRWYSLGLCLPSCVCLVLFNNTELAAQFTMTPRKQPPCRPSDSVN